MTKRKPISDHKSPGRPAHVPTEALRKQVEAMASYGVPHEDIAKVVGISDVTLKKHYDETLATASSLPSLLSKNATDSGESTRTNAASDPSGA